VSVATWARIPDADRRVAHWHVAPWIDSAGYGWSWLWLLVPLLAVGSERGDYLAGYILVLVLSDVHRHYGLPYVYLDGAVRRRYPIRFGLFAAVLLGAFVVTPLWVQQRVWLQPLALFPGLAWIVVLVRVLRAEGSRRPDSARDVALAAAAGLGMPLLVWESGAAPATLPWLWLATAFLAAVGLDLRARSHGPGRRFVSALVVAAIALAALPASQALAETLPRGRLRFAQVFDAIAVFAGIWNFWHVYAQKYGILRMYDAKGEATGPDPAARVPGFVDRWLVFAFLPVYVFGLGPSVQEQAYRQFRQARGFLPALGDFLEAVQPVALPLAVAFLAGALTCYALHEWRVHHFRHPARNSMALGTVVLGASFLVVDPVKAYLAFAFSHAIEYMVFVWAFQRRRYRAPLRHDPPIGRILRHPAWFYGLFTGVLAGVVLYLGYFGGSIFSEYDRPRILGISGGRWILAWTVYQSLMHFYYDGFLWKMRDDRLTADL